VVEGDLPALKGRPLSRVGGSEAGASYLVPFIPQTLDLSFQINFQIPVDPPIFPGIRISNLVLLIGGLSGTHGIPEIDRYDNAGLSSLCIVNISHSHAVPLTNIQCVGAPGGL